MPKSKRNKLKAFCHKLLHSSESISRKSKSLLIHWKALLNRKNLRDISKRAAFFIETAFYISKYQKKLIFQAFQRIKNLLFLRRNAVERLKDLIYKNLSQTFSFFRVKTAGLNAEKITSSCWKIAFIIKILLQKRKIDVFQNLKKGLMRNWGYKVRNLLNIYQEIERKNIDFGFKYLLRHQLKSEVQKQGFEGNLKKLVNCLQGLITKKKYNAFLRIKTHSFKYNLRKIIRLYKHSMKNGLRQAFFKWRGNLIIKKIQKRNLTNKVKGKILLSFSRNESNLTLKNGFLRWKVRADKNLLKNTMDR